MVPSWRIGQGWDRHLLVSGRRLVLGGVAIPFEKGLAGHYRNREARAWA